MATQDCQTRQTITDATRDIHRKSGRPVSAQFLDRMTTDRISLLLKLKMLLSSLLSLSLTRMLSLLVSSLQKLSLPYIAPNPYTGIPWGGAPHILLADLTYGTCGC